MARSTASSGSNSFVLGTPLVLAIENNESDINVNRTAAAVSTVDTTPLTAHASAAQPRILVFDVNQTMLDLTALRPQFERVFGSSDALHEWFSLLLRYSLVVTLVEAYSDFGTVAGAALEMLASVKRVRLSAQDKTRILQGLLTLPPHSDVRESLTRLRTADARLVTLTNSSSAAIKAQLENAGLAEYFEESISVDSVGRFKPHLAVYRAAAAHLGAKPHELRLVAAHAWDVFGAMRAGWRAAFVARQGAPLFPLAPKPDIIGPDLRAVTDAILRPDC